jgi:elongation factor Ts
MTASAAQIKELRQVTGAGVLECRKALEESGGDLEKAAALLRERGMAAAAGRADREARDGVVDLYSHGEGRVGVMVEVNCETDFVARTAEFRRLAHEISLQVAASSPRWVRPEDVPAEAIEHQRQEAHQAAERDGKPEGVIARIVEGRVNKFLDDNCLLRQPYIRDEAKTVAQVLQEAVATTGENIVVRRFVRWSVGRDEA